MDVPDEFQIVKLSRQTPDESLQNKLTGLKFESLDCHPCVIMKVDVGIVVFERCEETPFAKVAFTVIFDPSVLGKIGLLGPVGPVKPVVPVRPDGP
jgi:hypothetical protein